MTDMHVYNAGSLLGFEPVSDAAHEWFRELYPGRSGILWCDHFQAEVMASAMVAEGFELEPRLAQEKACSVA
jgi:hypothetical protein